jgi:hypothetical protein
MSNRINMLRLALTASLTLAIGLASAASASATVTIGQLLTPNAAECSGADIDFVQPTVTSGASYVVPPGNGQKIVSWSVNAPSGANQAMKMNLYRPVSGTTFQVVGHDGPHNLTASAKNTFPTSIAVKPGDVLGLHKPSGVTTGCSAPVTGETGDLISPFTDFADGATGTFSSGSTNFRLSISAEVASPPSNDFSLGKVKKNKNKGTALLTVDVPGPGKLELSGAGVKPQRSLGGARISKEVDKAGPVTLKIKAKGKKKAKLADRGKVKVKANITFTPTGDLPGVPSTETKPLKLIDNG